jgi:hypothetical protein
MRKPTPPTKNQKKKTPTTTTTKNIDFVSSHSRIQSKMQNPTKERKKKNKKLQLLQHQS